MIMPTDANVPTTAQTVGTFEHMLTPNLSLRVDGVFTRSWHKQFTIDTNIAFDQNLNAGLGGYNRIDPNYRRITQVQFGAPAEYQAAIVELEPARREDRHHRQRDDLALPQCRPAQGERPSHLPGERL